METPLRRLKAVRALANCQVEVQWEDDSTMLIEMRDLITDGTVFASLKDPDLFATVRLGDRRRTIEWPDPINRDDVIADYCADALYLRGERQRGIGQALAKLNRAVEQLMKPPAEKEPA